MLRSYGATDFITGLRAYAALFVVVRHTDAFDAFGTIGQNLNRSGEAAVPMFFIIAGFSVAASYHQSRDFGSYLLRRLIRIWPLYAMVLTISFIALSHGLLGPVTAVERYGASLNTYNLLMHLTLLNFVDFRIANNILGVEWTIPIEIFWYVMIPLVIRRKLLLTALLASMLIHLGIRSSLTLAGYEHAYMMAYWLPFSHGPYFLVGLLAYNIRTNPAILPAIDRDYAARFVPLSAVATMLAVAASSLPLGYKSALIGASTAAIIAFHRAGQGHVAWLLQNRTALLIGTISYSLYLVHNPVAKLLLAQFPQLSGPSLFSTVLVTSVPLSLVLYVLLEKPINDLGCRITVPAALANGTAKPVLA
jgi:exopolysaccharide production protein ExoZ